MRLHALFPLLVLTACSNAPTTEQTAPEPEVATALTPGQWEVTAEVTKLTAMDNGTPAINTPAGTTTTISHCVGAEEVKKPAAEMFGGENSGDCQYRNFYMARGRLNASLSCQPKGLSGSVMTTVDGNFTADSLDATSTVETYLASSGDVRIATKVTGRRVGECKAA